MAEDSMRSKILTTCTQHVSPNMTQHVPASMLAFENSSKGLQFLFSTRLEGELFDPKIWDEKKHVLAIALRDLACIGYMSSACIGYV